MITAPAIPVIGTLLFRHSVRATARAAEGGDLQAVRTLAGIASTSSDAAARATARDALRSLPSQDAIDTFCREVLALGDPVLEKIALGCRYVPSDPGLQALFLYITGQEDLLIRSDPSAYHPALARGYTAASERIKVKALGSSSDPRKGAILSHALIGTDPLSNASSWSYGEWELVLSALTGEGAWEDLWLLAVSAPPPLAIRALNALKASGWTPAGDAKKVFLELVRDLPDAWTAPSPEKPLISLGNQNTWTMRLAFSRDGALLATGACDGDIAVWQVSSARLLVSMKLTTGSTRFLAFTPDNSFLIAGGDNGTLHCIGIPSGNAVWSYSDKDHPISSVVLSGNGEELIAGDTRGGIILIGCRTGKILQVIQGHPSPVTALSPDPDGKKIAAGHDDGTICCRDRATGTATWILPGTGDRVRAIRFTEHTDRIFVVHEQSLPALRDTRSGALVRTYAGHAGHTACHALSVEHQTSAIGTGDHMLCLWHWTEKDPAAEISFYHRRLTCCAMTPDGAMVAAGCNEGTVYLFSIPEARPIKEFRDYKQAVTSCAISPDGALLATAGGDGAVTLRGIPSGELLRTLRRPAGGITGIVYNTDGTYGTGIVAGTADGMVRLFSREEGSLIQSSDMYTPSVRALAVSHDGTYLACAGSDRSLRIWDLAKGSLVATCEGLKTTVQCITFLPDTSLCITGGWDGLVKFWDVPGGKCSGTLSGHTSIITCCCADPAGRLLVTGSNDTTVRIWHLDDGKKSIVIREAKKEVSCCAISPDGSLLATAGPDPAIRLYYLPDGSAAGTIPQVPGKPTALAFSDDGLMIAAGYDTGMLAFYSVHDRLLVRNLPAHAGAVTGLLTLQGENCIATSGLDGRIHIFRLPFLRPLSHTTLADLLFSREQEQASGTDATAKQWMFLCQLLSLRFQSEIEICPAFCDAGMYDIQIVG